MAADWIKMRSDLYRVPKVCLIADALMNPRGELGRYINQNCQCDMAVTRNVMRNATVGALVAVWGVMRHRGERRGDDLIVLDIPLVIVDDVADLPGFGQLMAEVGWAIETNEGLVFPRFFKEWNVDPDEEFRKQGAERQQRYRDNKRNVTRNVTVTSQSNGREREEIEKSNKDPPLPPKGGKVRVVSEGFDEFWRVYPRKQSKQAALKAWNRLNPSPELRQTILAAVAAQKTWRPWLEGIVPHGATWLNGRKWEDEPPPEAKPAPKIVPNYMKPPADPRTPEQKAADMAADRKRIEADKEQAASAAELLAKLRGGIGRPVEENP